MATEAEIRRYLAGAAGQFGVDPGLLIEIARLESGFNPGAVNDWDVNARNGTPSQGLMQFIRPTFESFWNEARQQRPDLFRGSGNFGSWQDQARLAAWAMANGKGSHWATYDRARQSAGGVDVPDPSPVTGGAQAPAQVAQPGHTSTAWRRMLGEDNTVAALLDRRHSRQPTLENLASFTTEADVSAGSAASGTDVGPFRFLPRRPGELGWQYLQRLGSLGGLENDPGNSQTTGGRHAPGSPHYDGRAIDYGDARNSRELLDQWAAFLRQNFDQLGLERVIWQEPGHYNHVDAATRRAALAKKRNRITIENPLGRTM